MRPRYGNTRRHVVREWLRYQMWKRGTMFRRPCGWCNDPDGQTWSPWPNAPLKFANGRSYGRWTCRWYGQCEAAPG